MQGGPMIRFSKGESRRRRVFSGEGAKTHGSCKNWLDHEADL